jgi:Polyketide cyclase / dehydrase and lipid transport
MRTSVSLVIDGASSDELFEQVATLDHYPAWMRLVHRVDPLPPDDGRLAWRVQLRARVGPFTRSKQLRMVRTIHEPGRRVRFERIQDDERDHAEWTLTATVDAVPVGARVIMDLYYSGHLWATATLERILDAEIAAGRDALRQVVTGEPTR